MQTQIQVHGETKHFANQAEIQIIKSDDKKGQKQKAGNRM